MISIDSKKCTKCGFCIDECPNYVFALLPLVGGDAEVSEAEKGVRTLFRGESGSAGIAEKNSSDPFFVRYPDQCCRCDHCVAICPADAITDDEMPLEKFEALPRSTILPEQIKTFLRSRRSIRAFQETPVPQDVVGQLIDAGIHAACASNGQTEGFLVIQDRNRLAELERLVVEILWNAGLKYLGSSLGRRVLQMRVGEEMVRQWFAYHRIIKNRTRDNRLAGMVFRNAPAVIVSHGLRANVDSYVNCVLASRNMEIMAQALGLGTCWIGFLAAAAQRSKRIARHLGIPDDRNIYSAIMLGYPKHEYHKTIPRRAREVRWL